MKLFPFRKIEFLSQQVDKRPQMAVVGKKRQLPWCAAELPDEGPIPLRDSSKMSPCTNTELWAKNVLQERNLRLCLRSSLPLQTGRAGGSLRQQWLADCLAWTRHVAKPSPVPSPCLASLYLHRCWQIL